ncbi:MAG: tetratricopeptide repeat protein, partial [Anaerolineae bacterium]
DSAATMLARLYLAQESPAYAVPLLRGQLARRPHHGAREQLLGQAYQALGERALAQQAFERALDEDLPESERQVVHEQLALLCLENASPSGDEVSPAFAPALAAAIAHLEAVALGPDPILAEQATVLAQALRAFVASATPEQKAQAHAQLGRVFLERGDLLRARDQFEAALKLVPDYPDAHAYLGHVWSLLGEPAHAEAHLRQAIDLAPENALPRYFLGMHDLRQGRLETGRDMLVAAYELEPGNPALCAAVADSYLRGDAPRYAVAEQWLLAAVANAPGDVRFYLLLAHLYVETGLDPGGRGVATAQVAVELAPENPEAYETLGWAYYLGGQTALAVEPLEQALELAESARAHYRLGEVYRALGLVSQARAHLVAAVDLDWNGVVGEQAGQTLVELYQ